MSGLDLSGIPHYFERAIIEHMWRQFTSQPYFLLLEPGRAQFPPKTRVYGVLEDREQRRRVVPLAVVLDEIVVPVPANRVTMRYNDHPSHPSISAYRAYREQRYTCMEGGVTDATSTVVLRHVKMPFDEDEVQQAFDAVMFGLAYYREAS